MEISRFMGHSNPRTTLEVYTHLFNVDDHAQAMAALGALAQPAYAANVVPLHRVKSAQKVPARYRR